MEKMFKVNEKQMARFQEWVTRLNPPDPYEEDCAGTSYFEWHFRSSGIGTEVYVTYDLRNAEATIHLTLGDDGEFLYGTHEEV